MPGRCAMAHTSSNKETTGASGCSYAALICCISPTTFCMFSSRLEVMTPRAETTFVEPKANAVHGYIYIYMQMNIAVLQSAPFELHECIAPIALSWGGVRQNSSSAMPNNE
eukprot:6659279-Pyramimonas_sp.AAC.1